MNDALARGAFTTPLVIGDRLDTDIEGANAAGPPSLMVLTGVNNAADMVHAAPGSRPDFRVTTICAHCTPMPKASRIAAHPAWQIETNGSTSPCEPPAPMPVIRCELRAGHRARGVLAGGGVVTVAAGDDTARAALQRWSLLT